MHAQHLIAKVKKHQLWREVQMRKEETVKTKTKHNKSQHMPKI